MAHVLALARTGDWAASKLPFLVALPLWGRADVPDAPALLAAAAMVCGQAAFGYALNDIADRDADARAGKPNRAAGLSAPVRAIVLLASAALAVAAGAAYSGEALGPLLVVANCALAAAYSVPPVRLKERGAAALAAAAASQWFLPGLALLAPTPGDLLRPQTWVLAALGLAIGIRWIAVHQHIDRERDDRSGVVTFATSGGAVAAVVRIAFAAEVALLAAALLVCGERSLGPVLALALWCGHAWAARRVRPAIVAALLTYAHAPLAGYYFLLLPVGLALAQATSTAAALGLALAFCALGHGYVAQMAGELADARAARP